MEREGEGGREREREGKRGRGREREGEREIEREGESERVRCGEVGGGERYRESYRHLRGESESGVSPPSPRILEGL